MGLGERFDRWLGSTSWGRWIQARSDEFNERKTLMDASMGRLLERFKESGDIRLLAVYAVCWGWIWFGGGILWLPTDLDAMVRNLTKDVDEFQENPQLYLESKIEAAMSNPEVGKWAEFVGTIITKPVLDLLEDKALIDNPDPHQMSRRFHGIASGLPWAATAVDSTLKAVLGDRAPEAGKQIQSIYWGLGLGFLGWQTLAPLLSCGLQPSLERYYNRLYHPKRFSPNEARDLMALGKISAAQMKELLLDQGWRDGDIQTWIDLSYRELSEGTLWDLYSKGAVSQGWIVQRLRALGYNPNDISYLFLVNEKEEVSEVRKYTLSTAKTAFKNGLIGEAEFRQILTTLKYESREIELQIANIRAQLQQDAKELSTSQVKALYTAKIIGRDEARNNLKSEGYDDDLADKLIRLWDDQATPKAARLNRSTITAAYREGVISRSQAKTLLMEDVGYNDQQTEFLLKTEDAIAKRKAAVVQPTVKALTLAQLKEFVTSGLMTRDELNRRAEFNRYSAADKTLIIESFFFSPLPVPLELSESVLISAYVAGVITRDDLTARLTSRNIAAEDVELVIKTVELENPDVFGEYTGAYIGQPSIGQVQLALQRGLITEAQFRERLSALGFSLDAIEILLFNTQYQTPAEPKRFTDATIFRLYGEGWITRQQALERLLQNEYTIEDANLLIDAEGGTLDQSEIAQLYEMGFLDEMGFVAAATNLGWSIEEIERYLLMVGA